MNGPRDAIDDAAILQAAAALGVLGPGAGAGPRLIATLCDPQVSAREVCALIHNEPAICARVLRVANSPLYGQGRTVSSIERSLVLLGLDAVRGIAAAVCLDHTMTRSTKSVQLDTPAMLQHSVATAAAAEAVAQAHRPALAPTAFIAGLLHNLGIIVQAHVDPAGMSAMCAARRQGAEGGLCALEAELAAVGHAHCGAVVFTAWHLPEALVAAARHHHEPTAAPEAHRDLAALVHLGSVLALQHGETFLLEPRPVPPDPAAVLRLGLADGEFEQLAGRLSTRVSALRSALLAA